MLKLLLCFVFLLVSAACGRGTDTDIVTPTVYNEVTPHNEENDTYTDAPINDEGDVDVPPDIPMHNEYIVTLEIDPEARTIQGISRISFTNRSAEPLDTVVLRVFLNAFEQDVYPRPYTSDLEWRMLREDESLGYIYIEDVLMNNEAPDYNINNTVLTLKPEEPIEPNTTVMLSLQYRAYVPQFGHIIGGNEAGMWLGMFLPVLSVYDEDGWHSSEFYPVGNPFFLETADFHVTVTTPLQYNVIGTGHRTEELIYDTDMKTTRFIANMTRDFAFAVLSPYYSSMGITTESGIEINFHYISGSVAERAEHILDFVRYNMEHFENRVGIYPFRQISIVEANTIHDSIAFSQVIFTDTRHLIRGDLSELTHSLGSQWFASVVGTNRVSEPWLDKGLTRFVAATLRHNTPELLREYMEQTHSAISVRTGLPLTDGLWAYTLREDFIAAQGYRAVLMIYQLQQRMGEENFWMFINLYYQTFSFRIASVSDFIYLAEEVYGSCLREFFNAWMTDEVIPALR